MWRPGTLLCMIDYDWGNVLDKKTCLVLGARELSYGTNGPTCEYMLLGSDMKIFTKRVNNKTDRCFTLIKET
jgi:hypothetical protein